MLGKVPTTRIDVYAKPAGAVNSASGLIRIQALRVCCLRLKGKNSAVPGLGFTWDDFQIQMMSGDTPNNDSRAHRFSGFQFWGSTF